MYGYLRVYICEMCRVDDVSRREAGRRQTAFSECEPRAWAHAGSRAGSFRVLAGPGTTAGRSLSSRASSLASLFICAVDAGRCGKVTKNLGLPSCASASNVPSVSHCCWTWASSFNKASLRVLDFGGAGGVAIVVVRVSVLQWLSVLLLLSQFNARAATGVQVRVLAVIQHHCSGQRVMRCSDATRVILQASLAIGLAVRH